METKVSFEQLKEELNKKVVQAKEYLNDNEKIDQLFKSALEYVDNFPALKDIGKDIIELVEMVKCYVSGEYKDVPSASIFTIVAGLIYLVTPIDIIPDAIPLLGFIDDIAMFGLVMHIIQPDLNKFREWKATKASTKEETQEEVTE